MFQEGTNGLYFYARFNSYGDIKQNRVKIGIRHRILREILSYKSQEMNVGRLMH